MSSSIMTPVESLSGLSVFDALVLVLRLIAEGSVQKRGIGAVTFAYRHYRIDRKAASYA